MPKLIVTGSTGFIGQNLIPLLENTNFDVYAISSRNMSFMNYKNITYLQCDILNEESVSECLRSIKATHLFHLAWRLEPSNYNLPTNFDWIKSSISLLEKFKENGGKRILVAGTGFEYDCSNGLCDEEKTPLVPSTLYGSSKNILRQYYESYVAEFGLELVWARLFFLYGPHENESRLVSYLITSILKGQKATINNGAAFRDFMYIKDSASLLLKLMQSDFKGPINVSSGQPVRLADIGKQIDKIIGGSGLLEIKYPNQNSTNVVYANANRIGNLFNLPAFENHKIGLEDTINWWKEKLKK